VIQAILLAGPSLRNYFKTLMLSRFAAQHPCLLPLAFSWYRDALGLWLLFPLPLTGRMTTSFFTWPAPATCEDNAGGRRPPNHLVERRGRSAWPASCDTTGWPAPRSLL